MKILSVVGARPNLPKIAPILHAIQQARSTGGSHARSIESLLVHTGQHYDDEMSAVFFADLNIPSPDRHLGVGSGSHATQTAEVMRRFEPVVLEERPDVVLVVGDVNSTLACALTAVKLTVRVVHVEAGLRSFDREMPEEINRVLTDAVADVLFTTEESANRNLEREGYPAEKVFFVGDVMIDSLRLCRPLAERSTILDRLGLTAQGGRREYALVTLHRPSNVDAEGTLRGILAALAELARDIPVVAPVHPRTRARIEAFGLTRYVQPAALNGGAAGSIGRVSVLDPVGYADFLRLMSDARVVLTDSGGIQAETTSLGIPCLTLRHTTERPVTLTAGTNTLVGTAPDRILSCARAELVRATSPVQAPPLWDGHAAERIVHVLLDRL